MVQDGEDGGQWVVERTDLKQVRTGEVYPYTHIHSALHTYMYGRIWNMQYPGIPEVSWQEAQTLFKEGNSQGNPTAEDDPQG